MTMASCPGNVAHLGHGAPDFGALHVGDVAGAREIQPIGLVQLGADQEVEVRNALVLSHQRCCQAQLAVRFHYANHLRQYQTYNFD